METPPRRRRVPGVFLAIILVDLVVIAWGWNQLRLRGQRYDGGGLDLGIAPAEAPRAAPRAAAERPAAPLPPAASEALPLVVKEPRPGPAPAKQAAARAARRAPAGDETGPLVRAAKSYFYGLKKSARFRNSKVLREWERDFLASPELRAINERYQRDRNAVRFVAGAARSPAFSRLISKHLAQPDIQAFIMQMTSSQDVAASAGVFCKDAKIEEMIDRIELPGIGSIGKLRAR